MKKYLSMIAITALAVAFTSCSDNDEVEPEVPQPEKPVVSDCAYVLNQGTYSMQIEGSLTRLDYASGTAEKDLFQKINGISLGSTPQYGVSYGSKIYLGIYESNVIHVINRNTARLEKTVKLDGEEGQNPRSLVAKDGKVYISMYNGYVSRLDTLSLAIDKTVKVGPNPEIMAIRGDYLYVPNSDGMNWQVGYGTTATKIKLSTFTVEKTFEVGLNPYEFASNGTDLFLLCKGNYADVASKIYRVDANDALSEVAEASLLAVNDSKLYYINAPYGAETIEYAAYDIADGSIKPMVADNGVESPAGIGVDPVNGNIVITSYSMENGWASYTTDGYAKVYDKTGALLHRYETGVGPVCVFF